MKLLTGFGLALLFVAGGLAQHRSFGVVQFGSAQAPPPNTYGTTTGFGRVLYPGTGHPPPIGNTFSITDPTFPSRLGATVGGFSGSRFRRSREGAIAIPYAYPVTVGGYYGVGGYGYGDNGYGYGDQQPNVTIINPPQQTPQVIINQNFVPERATPVIREYGDDSADGVHVYEAPGREAVDTSGDGASYYLIAFKDHSIYSAFAYWIEGDTLHYVTPQRVHNQASLSLVDRELTDKLNRDRNMQVKLPNTAPRR